MVEAGPRAAGQLGFELVATRGTAELPAGTGTAGRHEINKVLEGQPHIVDLIIDGGIQLVLNTTAGKQAIQDSFSLREAALNRIGIRITQRWRESGPRWMAMQAISNGRLEVAPLQSYFDRLLPDILEELIGPA